MTTPAAMMREAAEAIRLKKRAVPGFSDAAAELLALTADGWATASRERREVTLRLAREVLGPVTNRTEEGNDHA